MFTTIYVTTKTGIEMVIYSGANGRVKICKKSGYNPMCTNYNDTTIDGTTDECYNYLKEVM